MIRRKCKLIFLLPLAILFTGCAAPYVTHEYFSPSADGGKVISTQCRGTTGPKRTVKFSIENVIIHVSANFYKNAMYVSFGLRIPNGSIVTLSSSEALVVSMPSLVEYKNSFRPIYPEHPSWEINKPIIGGSYKVRGFFSSEDYPKQYTMQTMISMPETSDFVVRIPEFTVNKVNTTLPDINFKKKKSVEFFPPFNC